MGGALTNIQYTYLIFITGKVIMKYNSDPKNKQISRKTSFDLLNLQNPG